MKVPIVLASHNKKGKMVEKVGVCVLCDEPVYFSGRGISGEIDIEELKKIPNPRFAGGECLIRLAYFSMEMMNLPFKYREELKNIAMKLIKNEK